MKRIVFIMPSGLPVPATYGGAVETLIQSIADINEIQHKIDIVIVSVYEKEAEILSQNYQFTKYIYVKKSKLDNIHRKIYDVFRKFFKKSIFETWTRRKMVRLACKESADLYVFEVGSVYSLRYYHRFFGSKKVFLHNHWAAKSDNILEGYYQGFLSISSYVENVWFCSSYNKSKYEIYEFKNCIDVNKFKRAIDYCSDDLRKKFQINKESKVILYVGRIIPEKGVLEMIKAFSGLSDDAILLIVGSRKFAISSKSQYEKSVYNLVKNNSRVKLCGYIPNDELYKYYALADFAVIPSIWEEPAGLVVIEALASGTPIITTGTGGIKDYCDETCAIFVDKRDLELKLKDSMHYLCNNPELLNKMSSNAISFSKKFDLSCYYDNLVNILYNGEKDE